MEKPKMEMPISELSFETALDELSQISTKMNDDSIELEKIVKQYKRAKELHSYCSKLLSDAKVQIRELETDKDESD